jgi:8-oxo-dGTP diphosphatase
MRPLHVVGAAIIRDHRCLVAQRGPAMSLPGKWELPGGKVEPGEQPDVALAREIEEELGLRIAVGPLLGSGSANVGSRVVQLDVYAATIVSGTLTVHEHARVSWATGEKLAHFDWAEADIPCVARVEAWLSQGIR